MKGMKVWMDFSKNFQPVSDDEYPALWPSLANSHNTITTIGWYAEEDNKVAYDAWKRP